MVNYIEYNGEQLPVKVGYYALKKLQETGGGKTIANLDGDLSLYEPLLYYSLQKGARLEGVELKYKMEDMEDILEAVLFTQFMDIVADAFETEPSKQLEVGGNVKKPQKNTSKK